MGFALAADASSVSLVYGGRFKPFKWRYAAIPAAAFGFAQAVMPAIGWGSGDLIYRFVQAWGHWIAFVILLIVGGKFILDSRHENDAEVKSILKPLPIFLSAFATSIDAFAVGISLAMDGTDIVSSAAIIGVITLVISVIGVKIGAKVGDRFGKRAELAGGLILIAIGMKIVVEHLGLL